MRLGSVGLMLSTAVLLSGCASMQATRKAQFLSDSYNGQVIKNIVVLPLIDGRTDKGKDMQSFLANKNIREQYLSNPLASKGFTPKLINMDVGKCSSLATINNINELACVDDKVLQLGDLFLLVSVDQYVAPEAMHVVGTAKVTGIIYSKSVNAFLWKDSLDGKYGGAPGCIGVGCYLGMLTLKAMSSDMIFRNNVYTSAQELLNSVPPVSRKRMKEMKAR